MGSLRATLSGLPLCSPATESMALPPLSEPTLPPCSAGEVRSVEPSVAAVLPSSSEAGAESRTRAVTGGKRQQALLRGRSKEGYSSHVTTHTHKKTHLTNSKT